MSLIVILFASGLIALVFEIFIPGGIIGMVGAALLLSSVALAFKDLGASGGFVTLILAVFLAPVTWLIGIAMFPRSRLGKGLTLRTELRKEAGCVSSEEREKKFLGKEGTAATVLRPAGIALVDGERVDVVSEGVIIEKGASVRVVRVEGNQVIVKEVG